MSNLTRRSLLSTTALASVTVLVQGCKGLTAQQVATNVINIFQTAVTAITALLAQLGISVPVSILSLVAKIQGIATNVVAGIDTIAASGFVQQALALFQQIVPLATAAMGGSLPSVIVSGVDVVLRAFAWLMQTLGVGAPTTAASAPVEDPTVILSSLNRVIAAAR